MRRTAEQLPVLLQTACGRAEITMTTPIDSNHLREIILDAMRTLNMARAPDAQLQVAVDAPLFGPDSPLDSLGLVSLLFDIEEALRDEGIDVSLSDERAMSQTKSPFRSVPALVDFIQQSQDEPS
jgi:acyl carrier protein